MELGAVEDARVLIFAENCHLVSEMRERVGVHGKKVLNGRRVPRRWGK